MALSPQKFRELVFQLIYSKDFIESDEGDVAEFMMQQFLVTRKVMKEADARCCLVREKQDEIDARIKEASKSYDFERISRVERNVLRLGTFELYYDSSIPPKVAIAESIRIAKKFGSPEGANFVNAIMDALYQSMLEPAAL